MRAIEDKDIDKVFLQLQMEISKKNNLRSQNLYRGPGFHMELPAGFEEAGQDIASGIFFSKNRPEIILIKPESHAGISFQILQKSQLECGDLKSTGIRISRILKQADAKNVFYDQGIICSHAEVFWFDYKSFASDEGVYNLVFIFEEAENFVMGAFYCMFKHYDRWKPEMIDFLHTIEAGRSEDERI